MNASLAPVLDPDCCLMQVPVGLAERVAAIVKAARAGEVAPGLPETAPSAGDTSKVRRSTNGGGVVWPERAYDLFAARAEESHRRTRRVMDVLAATPGQLQATSVVAAAAGLPASEVRAALGKLTLWMQSNIDEVEWPFGWMYGSEVENTDTPTQTHYWMSGEQASAWLAARERTPEPPQ